MMWKEWKELGWMEKLAFVSAAAEAIPAPEKAPDTVEEPNWKSDDSEGGQIRDNTNGVGVSTPREVFGHQRPS
jgi:hypothetical protein